MRQIISGGTGAALLVATLYAPLFHIHTHPGEAATVHAHLPEFEAAEDESVVHMESEHSHANARSIDILTTTAPQVVQFASSLVSIETLSDIAIPCCGYVPLERPRAHSPPAVHFQIPRAPPA